MATATGVAAQGTLRQGKGVRGGLFERVDANAVYPLGPAPSIPMEVHGGRRAALQRPVPLRVKMQGQGLDREVEVASLMGGFGAGRVRRELGAPEPVGGAGGDSGGRQDVEHRSG